MAESKLMSPNTKIVWVPVGGFVDWTAPTLAELTSGIDISCAIETGYTLNPTDPDMDTSKSICDNANVETPTLANYEMSLTLFRAPLGDANVYQTAYNLFKVEGVEGYLVRRVGLPQSTAFAANQKVEVYGGVTDFPRVVESDNMGPIKMMVPFIPNGRFYQFYEIPVPVGP